MGLGVRLLFPPCSSSVAAIDDYGFVAHFHRLSFPGLLFRAFGWGFLGFLGLFDIFLILIDIPAAINNDGLGPNFDKFIGSAALSPGQHQDEEQGTKRRELAMRSM